MRTDGRTHDQMRTVEILPHFTKYAEGSCLIKMGETHVLCTASIDSSVPKWMQGSPEGWVSAEYGMLPRSTHTRIRRDKALTGGRSQEISRLIGRALRASIDLKKIPELQIMVDCDVLQADGGTRTAAITGGFVALGLACQFAKQQGMIKENPLLGYVSAISVGLKPETALLDLNYDEDSTIDTDMNFVMNHKKQFIEVQGTAEGQAFSKQELDQMTELATKGCLELHQKQAAILGEDMGN